MPIGLYMATGDDRLGAVSNLIPSPLGERAVALATGEG
jgi:hypothetical protein